LHKLTDSGVLGAAEASGAKLLTLELYWHHARSSACVAGVAKACQNLVKLNLSGCQQLEDTAVRAIARNCSNLSDLDLTRCPLLTDAALAFLCPRLKKSLKILNLYADSQVVFYVCAGVGWVLDMVVGV
jgi:F-box/leucine-rich repeat protein 2/20